MRLVTHDVKSAQAPSNIAEDVAESDVLKSEMMFKNERETLAQLGYEEYGVAQQEIVVFKNEMEVW